jgi:hypothetical protein
VIGKRAMGPGDAGAVIHEAGVRKEVESAAEGRWTSAAFPLSKCENDEKTRLWMVLFFFAL